MAGGVGTLGTESLHIIHADAEAAQVQPAVQEHGAVAAGKHKAVAVEPARLGGVNIQKLAVQYGADFCTANGQAHVARCFVKNSINGKTFCFVGCFLKNFRVHASLL